MTPLDADAWERWLSRTGLSARYPTLASSIRNGFDTGIPSIHSTYVPFNSPSLLEHRDEFERIVRHEFSMQRYIGPFTRRELETLIGPFQTSPLSLVPKPHKPNVYRLVQNFSFPHAPSNLTSSINYHINSSNYPCTWGTFDAFSLLCWRLPPGSQGAVRDVSEAYHTIPLAPSQWPGAVVRLSNDDEFVVDTNAAFGVSSHAGVYGLIGDAFADIVRFCRMGPVTKWVDDNVFLRILRIHLADYNTRRHEWRAQIVRHGGAHHDGGRIWFGGDLLPDGRRDEFLEDMSFPLKDLSLRSPRSSEDARFTYCMADIDALSDELRVPWQLEKDYPFAHTFPFNGFQWDLESYVVSIPRAKAEKYIKAIDNWLGQRTHTLRELQKLHGKLWHASLVAISGRAYLTSLEAMFGVFSSSPFKRQAAHSSPPDSRRSPLVASDPQQHHSFSSNPWPARGLGPIGFLRCQLRLGYRHRHSRPLESVDPATGMEGRGAGYWVGGSSRI